MSSYFQGKTVLITGASSGIGAALANSLANRGANLILLARQIESLKALAGKLEPKTQVQTISLDITDELAVNQLASRINLHAIDILINNAGIAHCARFEDLFQTDFRSMMDVNYLGQVWMTRLILPVMKENGEGQIINIASMAGVLGLAGYTAYGASKHALVGFTEALRNELSGSNIDLTLVLPSDVDTPQLEKEALNKPAATRALAGRIKPLSANRASTKILQAIEKRKREVVVSPFFGRVQLKLCRLFPGISKKVLDSITRPHNH
ncbi:MAG: SDR family NAD(P)-dependent oxidoreductase [Porticoccaceae bacterium]